MFINNYIPLLTFLPKGIFMFFAKCINNDNDELVEISDAKKDHEYVCPLCGEKLIIKATSSLCIRPHFAHKNRIDCDTWKHDMSDWHYDWQLKFPKECREVIIENNGIKHRADILINGTVIEFQHSPISRTEIIERSEFYTRCGFQVVWVFDANGKIQNVYKNCGAKYQSIDPFICLRGQNLEWKRARRDFQDLKLPRNVFVFIQYETLLLNSNSPNQPAQILVPLIRLDPKDIIPNHLYNNHNHCYFYILPNNFLRQFGVIKDEHVWSISQLVRMTS
ncbi:MAG: hypothetical protein J6C93_07220 [Clostridia bacterium]|nr:hypothetical protein [Clostridia bacterium]